MRPDLNARLHDETVRPSKNGRLGRDKLEQAFPMENITAAQVPNHTAQPRNPRFDCKAKPQSRLLSAAPNLLVQEQLPSMGDRFTCSSHRHISARTLALC